jgi:hypothetical protein
VEERERPSPVAAVAWAVAAALIVAYLVVFAASAAARLRLPVELMYGEAVVLAISRRIALGEPLYPAPDHAPLLVTAYGPVYYLLVGELQRLFGDGYATGRVVSLIATLAAAATLAWSVRQVGGRWFGGLLAAGLFLTQNMTALLWAPLHRVDPLALCLTLGGVALATAGRIRLAALLLVLAALTKQSYLVAPLAVLASLWPNRRAMLWFGGLFVLGLGGAVAVCSALSGGWFLWHTVVANANPYDETYLWIMIGSFVHFNGLLLLAAAALFGLRSLPADRSWRRYFLLLLLPTVAGFGKLGASSNYWLELTAATAALIGILADRLAACPRARTILAEPGLALMVLGALLVPIPGYQAVVREAWEVLPAGGSAQHRARTALAARLAGEPGELLTDDPDLAVAAGRPVLFEFTIFELLADQGIWDERPIVDAIQARCFGLVILSTPLDAPGEQVRWSAGVGRAIGSAYAPAGQQYGYWLYRPTPIGYGG